MSKYRLQIADRVCVRVRLETAGAAPGEPAIKIAFTLDMDRISQTRVTELIKGPDVVVADVIKQHTHGWQGQTLVVDAETGAPAAFSQEALGVLLDYPGMPAAVWIAYMRDMGVAEKN